MKILFALGVAVIVGAAFPAWGQDKPPAEQIVIGIQQEPDTFMPLLGSMAATAEISAAIGRGMVGMDAEWKYFPEIVEWIPSLQNGHIEMLDNGKRMKVAWRLREGLKWGDGTPLTVDDVIFAFEYTMNDKVPVVSRNVEKRIEKIEKIDDRNFVVHWKSPYCYANLGHPILPKHLLGPLLQQDASQMENAPFGRQPVFNGPYRLVEWKPGDSITVEASQHWGGDKPRTRRIVWRFMSNTQRLQSNILAGAVDAISTTGIPLDEALILQKGNHKDLKFYIQPGLTWEHVDMNLDNPILRDKRVRQAIIHAIDREGIVRAFFEDKQPVAHSWLPPRHYGYNPDVKKYPYDPRKAGDLLDAAGWKMGAGGLRVNDRGEVLRLEISTTQGNNMRERVQRIIQANLKKVGIELVIKNYEAKVFFSEITRKRKFSALAMYAWVLGPQAYGEDLWTSDNIPSEKNNWLGQNFSGWRHPRIDEIDHKIPETIDEAERIQLFHEQQRIWSEEVPCIPLYFRAEVSVTKAGFQNWMPTGADTPPTWNCERWILAK